jgi:osmotically-inducible protein OsmY
LSNAQVKDDVLSELAWDKSIDSTRLTVTVDDGLVILGGTVDHFHEKVSAIEDARIVTGVREVVDNIDVDLTLHHVSDAELALSARAGLDANVLVPHGAIEISVANGWVTMVGNVHHHYERQAAEHVVRHLRGLGGFTDLVTLSQAPVDDVGDVAEEIRNSFVRNAAIDAANIKVTLSKGVVTLEGTVRSQAERREAERSALRAPGVVSVDDQLVISQESAHSG